MNQRNFERLSRSRNNPLVNNLFAENKLTPAGLISPLYIIEGVKAQKNMSPYSDIKALSIDLAVDECAKLADLGIGAVYISGFPDKRDDRASSAYFENGIVQRALREIKDRGFQIALISEATLSNSTSDYSCGIIKRNKLQNDESAELLAKVALTHSQSGADVVALTGPFDGAVALSRNLLDSNGLSATPIISLSATYDTNFRMQANENYEFFSAQDDFSAPIAISNSYQALREIEEDLREGADGVMISPSLMYADLISAVKRDYKTMLFASLSPAENIMLEYLAQNPYFNYDQLMKESLTSLKRAGADLIICDYAKRFSSLYNSGLWK
jgi:porphobilinogen synthase